MEIPERQKILRLLVKEILVGTDTITVRHSLPIAGSEPPSGGPADGPTSPGVPPRTPSDASYLLRSGSDHSTLGRPLLRPAPLRRFAAAPTRLYDCYIQPHPDQFQHRPIHHSHPHARHQFVARNRIKVALQVRVVHRLIPGLDMAAYLLQSLVCRAA